MAMKGERDEGGGVFQSYGPIGTEMPLRGQSGFCHLPWRERDQGEGQRSMRNRTSCDMGRTLILLGEATQLLHLPPPCGSKGPRIFLPQTSPHSASPNAKRGEPPQGWHGFRLLLRGYWAAWAGTRAVRRAWQKGPSWWAEGARVGAWAGNSTAAPGRSGVRAGAPLRSLWPGASVPVGHRMVCLPLPNVCYPSASVTLG